MKIIGHGIDIVEIGRIERYLSAPQREWAKKIFSAAECKNADEPPLDVAYYAGRFAAKEAVSKALGTGFSSIVTWHGIEILRLPTREPYVELSGGASEVARNLGVSQWLISISRNGGIAMASVIAIGE